MDLTPVYTCDTPQSSGLDIIYIYGVIHSARERQSDSWKESLPRLAPPNTNVWGYDLQTELGGQFKAEAFLEKSENFLSAVYQLHQKVKGTFRPIVFCCYGVAGVLLKKALWQARQRPTQFDELFEYISGIIFLATPHLTNETTFGRERLADILGLPSILKEPAYSQNTLSRFVTVSERFEEINNMKIPILSCFEGKVTSMKASSWWPWTTNKILVDSDLARTLTENEKMVQIDSDLQAVFDNTSLPVHSNIIELLSRILKEAPEKIKENCESINGPEDLDNTSCDTSFWMKVNTRSLLSDEKSHSALPNTAESRNQSSSILNESFENISNASNMPETPSTMVPVRLPCYFFGPHTEANPYFEGRTTVLDEIETAFHGTALPGRLDASEPNGLTTFTIWGSRGVGKTQTALAYMFSRKSFYDAIFWIPAEDSVKIAQVFNQIAVLLGLETLQQSKDSNYSLSLVHEWLSNPWKSQTQRQQPGENGTNRKARWLMIFDSADQPDITYDYFPKHGQGFVLITSQQPNRNHFGKLGRSLPPLFENEADALFRKLMDFDYEPNPRDVLNIVKTLSYFPLAIFLMAGIIRNTTLPLDVFLERYNQDDIRAVYFRTTQSLISGYPSGYSQTLSSIWSIYNLEPGPSRILTVMAFLDPDCIQADIFTYKTDNARPCGFPTSPEEYFTSLAKLLTLNIVTRFGENDLKKVSIHRVVQDTIRAQIYPEKDHFRVIFAATIQALSSFWPSVLSQRDGRYPLYGRVDRWEKCQLILPHIESLRRLFELEKDKLRYGTLPFAMLVTEAAIYLSERGNQKQSTAFVDTAFKIQENCSNENTMEIRSALHDIKGSIAMTTNKPDDAIFHQEKSLSIAKENFALTGIETNRLAAAYSELGRAKLMSGRTREVTEYFEKSAEIRKRLPNYDEVQNFNPQRGLAMADCLGEHWDEAVEKLEYALKTREKKLGRDDREGGRTGALLYCLGNVKFRQGEMPESMKFHQRALDQIKATQGPEHLNAAHASYQLALDHITKGTRMDFDRAISLLEHALKVYCRDDSHKPELARVKFHYGFTLLKIGEIKKGNSERQDACKIRQSLVNDSRAAAELQKPDFDECVEFWTR